MKKSCLTLASIERRSAPLQEGGFSGGDLHYATEKLRWLARIIILKELGFDSENIKKLADRNKGFNDLKTV